MDFDQFSIALLLAGPDAPQLTREQDDRLQDAHLSHLAEQHSTGELLAAGPVRGAPDRELRGLLIYRCGVERARELAGADPAVVAGKFRHEVYGWMVPAGLVSFTPGRLPRSVAEATDASPGAASVGAPG